MPVSEVLGRTQELGCQRQLLTVEGFGGALLLERLLQDVPHTVYIDQIELQGPAAGRLQPLGAVAFGQAEPLSSCSVNFPTSGPISAARLR
jgi:hypothetical protein